MRVEAFGDLEVVGYEASEDVAAVDTADGFDVVGCDICAAGPS